MTSRERMLCALRREPVDRVPCCISFNPLSEAQLRGHTWNFPWSATASGEEQLRYQVEQLGLDQVVNLRLDLCRPRPGIDHRIWMDGDILHEAYTTTCGELHAAVRVNEDWPHGRHIPFHSDFNTGHYVQPWLQSEVDLACLMEVRCLDESREVLDGARETMVEVHRLADAFGLATMAHVGSGLTGALSLFGASELCMLTIENPGLVHAYLDHEHAINLRAIETLDGIDILRRNGFYETADLYGPAMLKEFVAPRLAAEAAAARAAGMLTSYTVHTGVAPILDYLADLPVDSLFGIDMAFNDLDLARVKERLCETKSLWIGPSSTFHLWKGPEATRGAVREIFSAFDRTGLILSPGVSAHSIMPWESTLAMVDEWRKLACGSNAG